MTFLDVAREWSRMHFGHHSSAGAVEQFNEQNQQLDNKIIILGGTMRSLRGLAILTLFAVFVGCSGNNKVVLDNYRNNYSVEVVGVFDNAISDGLPEGVNVKNVSKSILNNVISGLENKGLTKNDNKYRFKVKYSISYFGHKWKSGIHVSYIIGYNIQLIDESTGNVIASEKNDKDDTELLKVIEDVSDNIVNFATERIRG